MTFQFMAIYAGMFLTIRVPKAIGFRNQNDRISGWIWGSPFFINKDPDQRLFRDGWVIQPANRDEMTKWLGLSILTLWHYKTTKDVKSKVRGRKRSELEPTIAW
jgi:hypothetical protein